MKTLACLLLAFALSAALEQAIPNSPGDDTVITTRTPTLSVTNATGGGRQFRFRIYFNTGLIATSSLRSETTWQVPLYVYDYHLANGDPYEWDAQLVADGADTTYFSPRREFNILIPEAAGSLPVSPYDDSTVNTPYVYLRLAQAGGPGYHYYYRLYKDSVLVWGDTNGAVKQAQWHEVGPLTDGDYEWDARTLVDAQPLTPWFSPRWRFTVALPETPVYHLINPIAYWNGLYVLIHSDNAEQSGRVFHVRLYKDGVLYDESSSSYDYWPGGPSLSAGNYEIDGQLIDNQVPGDYSTPRHPFVVVSALSSWSALKIGAVTGRSVTVGSTTFGRVSAVVVP